MSTENNEEQIATLLKLAGRRPAVDAERAARVRAAVHEEWTAETSKRTRTRWVFAAAAIIVISLVAVSAFRAPESPKVAITPAAVVATLQTAGGAVVAGERFIEDGAPVHQGETLRTAGSATASLQWGKAILRLDGGSSVRFESSHSLALETGAIYFAGGGEGVVVNTRFGAVRDIGTQFEVRVAADSMRVRVRQGRVDLQGNGTREIADAGTELITDGRVVTRHAIPAAGAEWQWVVRAAPRMVLEGKRLSEIVEAVAAEKGASVTWSSNVSRDVVMHGSTPLSPEEALNAALAAAGLRSREEGGKLIVERIR